MGNKIYTLPWKYIFIYPYFKELCLIMVNTFYLGNET